MKSALSMTGFESHLAGVVFGAVAVLGVFAADLLSGQVVARMDKRERNKLAKAASGTDEHNYRRRSVQGLAIVGCERVFRHACGATHAPLRVDLPVHAAYAGRNQSSPACCCDAAVS
jgi:hypothetical protein